MLNYEDIRRIYRLEKNSIDLVRLDSDFISQLRKLIDRERDIYLDSIKKASFSKAQDFTNLKRLVEEIFQIREKKILNKALLTTRLDEYDKQNLTEEEHETFGKLLKVLMEHRKLLEDLFNNDSGSEDKTLNNMRIRVIKEVPSFIGADMKEYGPFGQGKETELPVKIAKLLIEKGLAKALT